MNESYFRYRAGEKPEDHVHPDFRPRFLEDYPDEDQRLAEETCGDNIECQFDFLATRNEDVAKASLKTSVDSDSNTKTLSKSGEAMKMSLNHRSYRSTLLLCLFLRF